MFINIIVPVFNSEKTIHKCLNSIKNQTSTNYNVFIIDDGSTDNSREIIHKFVNEDRRFIYKYQKNAGVSAARNNGLSMLNGDFVMFVDSDDYLEIDSIDILTKLANETEASIIEFKSIQDNYKYDIDKNSYLIEDYNTAIERMYKSNIIAVWNKFINVKLLENLFFLENLEVGEDALFNFQIIKKANKIIFLNKSLYHYCVDNTESLTRAKFTLKQFSQICAYEQIYQFAKQNNFNRVILLKTKKILQTYYEQNFIKLCLFNKFDKQYKLRNEIKMKLNNYNFESISYNSIIIKKIPLFLSNFYFKLRFLLNKQ